MAKRQLQGQENIYIINLLFVIKSNAIQLAADQYASRGCRVNSRDNFMSQIRLRLLFFTVPLWPTEARPQ
jgi:hypothetical protein